MNIKRIGLIGGSGVSVGGSSGTGSSTTVVDNLESLSKSAALSANMGRELNESKAPKVGYAPDLKVSYAEELVGRGESTPEVIGAIRPTSGEKSSIKDGNATIERIKGESVVWNALVKDRTDDDEGYTITLGHIILDYKQAHVNKGYVSLRLATQVGDKLAHKCLATISHPKIKIGNAWVYGNNLREYSYDYNFVTPGVDGIASLGLIPDADLEFGTYEFDITLHDLTLMFGAGNEPTTIEEFEARKPLGVTNEYNEGTIVSFQGGDVKSVGFNAFTTDNSEAGTINPNNGANVTSTKYYRSDFLPCVENTNYEFINCNHIYQYDKEKKFLTYNHAGDDSNPAKLILRLSNKTHYVRIVYVPSNENAVCIHLVHSGYRNRDYEPYVDDIHPLPNIKRIKDSNGDALFPYGLLSAGSVHDEITATKAIKRIGVVDMGTLSWQTIESFRAKLAGAAIPYNMSIIPNIVHNNYQPIDSYTIVNHYSTSPDHIIAVYPDTTLMVKDTSYTTAADFKQAMSGVLLYYELAEPIEVDLPEPLNMTYEAWDFGTEELVAGNATTPLNADIVYLFNAVDRIRENSSAIEDLEEHVKERDKDSIELLTNGNLKLTLKGETKEFMPATPSGDPMHYAYETAGAEYNGTADFIVKDAPWKDMVDTIEDKAKWGFDVVDASQVKQMTIGGTTYNYVQTTRTSPEGTTEPRYFLVGQASDGTWVEDETKVLHLPGHWYLNGLGDITHKELALIYENYHIVKDLARIRTLQITNIRTFFPLKNSTLYSQFNTSTLQGFYYSKAIEAVCILGGIPLYNTEYPNDRAPSIDDEYGFVNNVVLKYLPQHRIIKTNAQTYKSSTNLHVVPVVASQVSLYFSDIIQVSKNSILYVINNAVPTTPITITLHPYRYAQLAEDADIIAALEAKNAALEGTGGSISLVSA